MTTTEFFEKVYDFSLRHSLSCDGGWRTPARNSLVGGASASWHVKGFAYDLVADSMDLLLKAASHAQDEGFAGIELDLENRHLHLDARTSAPWHIVKQVDGSSTPLDYYLTTLQI